MAQLDTGEVKLRLAPHPIQEVIAAALEDCTRSPCRPRCSSARGREPTPGAGGLARGRRKSLCTCSKMPISIRRRASPLRSRPRQTSHSVVTSVADRGNGIDDGDLGTDLRQVLSRPGSALPRPGYRNGLAHCKGHRRSPWRNMSVTTQLGHGSVFSFTLPAVGGRARILMSSATIFVVDDEPQIRRVMRTTLASHGYVILEARSGEEAIETCIAARAPRSDPSRYQYARNRRPRYVPRDSR